MIDKVFLVLMNLVLAISTYGQSPKQHRFYFCASSHLFILQTVHLVTKDMNLATNATAFPNGNVNDIQHATTIVIMDRACRLDRAV